MNYCAICREVTNNYEEELIWDKNLLLIIVHCERCGHFKHQYLKPNIESSESR